MSLCYIYSMWAVGLKHLKQTDVDLKERICEELPGTAVIVF